MTKNIFKKIEEVKRKFESDSYLSVEGKRYLKALKSVVEEAQRYNAQLQRAITSKKGAVRRISSSISSLEKRLDSSLNKKKKAEEGIVMTLHCEVEGEPEREAVVDAVNAYREENGAEFKLTVRGPEYDRKYRGITVTVYKGRKQLYTHAMTAEEASRVMPKILYLITDQNIHLEQ